MLSFIENIFITASYIYTTIVSMVAEKPLYDKDFMDKFSDPDDMKELNSVVQNLKEMGNKEPYTITLKNGEKVTIVVY